jgi:hypothetical protein
VKARTAVVGLVALALAGGGGYTAYRLSSGGKVTEVSVDQAVEQYREQSSTIVTSRPSESSIDTTSPAPAETVAAGSLPAPGVYVYDTSGFDSIDALTGARHEYPPVTTITITPSGCGVRLRWDIAVERWDSWDWCLEGDAVRLVGWSGFHEFFGVAGRNDYECDGDPRPLDAEPGTTWQMVCRIGDSDTSTFVGTALERTTVAVEGAEVPALHVAYDVAVDGVSTGVQTIEGWYRISDGLPLRETVTVMTEQDTAVGPAKFEEQSTIELTSLAPRS